MICLNCGKHVDDGVRVCPFCGCTIEDDLSPDDPRPINPTARPHVQETLHSYAAQPAANDAPAKAAPAKAAPAKAAPSGGLLSPAVLISLLSLVFSLLCLISILSLRGAVRDLKETQSQSLTAINGAVNAIDQRLGELDNTLAKVQSEAYEQVASQSITITKDITQLTGPVDEGKTNVMFIVGAQGKLNVDTSFDWQKYNESTGGWVSIVFTGDATTNEQYGLRIYNHYDAEQQVYMSELHAQGITKEAAGTYRCMISDTTGISKPTAEGVVSIKAAEG